MVVGALRAKVLGHAAATASFPSGGRALSPAVTRPGPGVSAISPNVVDLASPPASFTITGTALANLGFGLPVVNFMRSSTLLAQVRATTLAGTTTLTVPFSTSLTVGAVQAQVYMQTGSGTYSLIGTLALTITDTRPVPRVRTVSAHSPDPAAPPTPSATIATTCANLGNPRPGLPVV